MGDGWECIADPVLRFSAGAIDGNLGDPVVIHEGGQYAMYYGAVLADFASETVRIFRATSSDGLVWNRPAVPLIEPGASGEWDAATVETPSIVKGPDGQYRLYYSGTYTTELEGARGQVPNRPRDIDGRHDVHQVRSESGDSARRCRRIR